jgi:hypothetical protein
MRLACDRAFAVFGIRLDGSVGEVEELFCLAFHL